MRALAMICLLFAGAAAAQVPVEGASSLRACLEQGKLVTIVLDSGVEDPNQMVVGVGPNYLSVENQKGDYAAYLFKNIERVVVQDGEVSRRAFRPGMSPVLSNEERRIIEQAVQVCRAHMMNPSGDQRLRMFAASALAARGQERGAEYLRKLIESNDVETAVLAAGMLWLAKGELPTLDVIDRALKGGDRDAAGVAANLAGMMHLESATPELLDLLDNITADVMGSALIALARLGEEKAVPYMLKEIRSRNKDKHEAAIGALAIYGGEDVKARLWKMMEDADLSVQFRILQALYKMGDEEAAKKLREEILDIATLQWDAAILLASTDDPAGKKFLRDWLAGRYDTDARTLKRRALAALALAASGDTSQSGAISELLNSEHTGSANEVLWEMGLQETRSLLPLLAPPINRGDLIASYIAIVLVTPEVQERFTSEFIE